ncbi:MAG: DUF6893 family small protein [Euzebya sp.]
MLSRMVFGAAALLVAAAVVQSIPDIKRYLEMREM